MASNWPSCINPCKNTRNDSWSCCSLIGHKKTKVLWHQSEARTTPTVWNWSGKTVSPEAPRFVLYFSSPKFFFARYDFPSPPLTAPGSPRMSPGAPRFVLYFSSPKFFFARYNFPSPPLTAPGSPRMSPGAPRFVLYFSSPKFFFARYDFPSPPLTAPGSPRMVKYSTASESIRNG